MAASKRRSAAEQRLDELYREHPESFVAGRDRLAKDIRAAGERDEADRVGKLRRPTVAAWLINRAALSSPSELERFAEVSRELEEAQNRALDGSEDAVDEWRAAAAQERDTAAAIVELADRLARDDGHPASGRALELVVETLRAAAADAGLRERVVGGRVEREQSGATLGTPMAAPPSGRGSGAAKRSAKRRGVAQARRELKRLEDELEAARAREGRLRTRVDETAEALRRERARLAESKRATAALRRQVKAAERRAQG